MTVEARDTDADWRRIADENPYWGVLSQERYRGATLTPDSFSDFMKSGEMYVQNLLDLIGRQYGHKFSPKRVLDFGCGVGRLLLPLATKCEQAVGVDIAPAMLRIAAHSAKAAGVSNVLFVEGDDRLSAVEGTFDLVNSLIVLQHIHPSRGYRLIGGLIDRLNIGGIGSLQLTYAKERRFFIHQQGRAKYFRRDGGTLIDLVDAAHGPAEGTITMFDYDLNQVFALISERAGGTVVVLPTRDDGHLGVHIIFKRAH